MYVEFVLTPSPSTKKNPELAVKKIAVNPYWVRAIVQVGNTDSTEVVLTNAHVFRVEGTYAEVVQKLWGTP